MRLGGAWLVLAAAACSAGGGAGAGGDGGSGGSGGGGGATGGSGGGGNGLSVSGTLYTDMTDITFDTVNAEVHHKRDVDASEDRCLATVELELLLGEGCRLSLEAADRYDTRGGLLAGTVRFSADSLCPGFSDAAEGEYVSDLSDTTSLFVVTPSLQEVPCAQAATCQLEVSLDADLFGRLYRVGDGRELGVDLSSLTVSGTVQSLGDTSGQCPCQDATDCPGVASYCLAAGSCADLASPVLNHRLVSFRRADQGQGQVVAVGSFTSPAWDLATGVTLWRKPGYFASAPLGLPDGTYQYKLVVNGTTWAEDPTNPSTVSDGFGGYNSVFVISGAGCFDACTPPGQCAADHEHLTSCAYDANGCYVPGAAQACPTNQHCFVSGCHPVPRVDGTQVTFIYVNPSALTVHVYGSFTANPWSDWIPLYAHDGYWSTVESLPSGTHTYKLIVNSDGASSLTDPLNPVNDGEPYYNSVVVVP